ncbi:MAG: hypothetical protein EA359_16505 [Balneolaceae bacterium]|nr:MAG: hypothetical protein EA359_16505 [Balneolaceae bacterium]
MKEKIHIYKSDDIKITYDVNRCIHSAKCVKGLPRVFDSKKKPWIQPENAPGDAIARVIEKCPTGALQYKMLNGEANEKPPSKNRIILQENGPAYFFGDLEIQDADGNVILRDTRFSYCRCGQSKNKPACDNSHIEAEFKGGVRVDRARLPESKETEHGRLIIKLMKNGPALLEGSYRIESAAVGQHESKKNIALCRCGGSANKPFCDGTHRKIGFEG